MTGYTEDSLRRVIPLPVEEAELIGTMLAAAFQEDPIQVAVYPDPARRAAILPLAFAAMVRAMAASGGHLTTTPERTAAALWSPPGTRVSAWALLRAQGRRFPMIAARTPPSSIRVLSTVFGRMGERRTALMPGPHWYLAVLGVEPASQGQGLGTLLALEGLARADADRLPAYLETETERNVGFYRNLGFRVVEELAFDRYGIRLWLMARDPTAPAGGTTGRSYPAGCPTGMR